MTNKFPGSMQIGDTELFAKFMAGDDAAFVEFFDRYDRRFRLYCMKVVGDMATTEDLVQELWEKVIKMRGGGEIAEPARYLMKMARNLCIKHLQRRRIARSIDELQEWEHPAMPLHEPSHLEELVKMAVSQLPFDQREVLVLHNYVGYGYEDIAAMRGESLGSVKMRAMRARARVGRIVSAFLALGKEEEGRSADVPAVTEIREKK